MISLYSFSENWTDLAISNPKEFIGEVERRYVLPEDFKRFLSLIKNGSKADKKQATKKSPWNVGDWIVEPYSPYLIRTLRKAIERGRLRKDE